MSLSFGKKFKYLVIQPDFTLVRFNSFGYNDAFNFNSPGLFNVDLGLPRILTNLLPDIKLQIPIALLGAFGDDYQSLLGFIQSSATKTTNILTTQVSTLINNLSQAGEFNGSIQFADNNFFTQERGEVSFNLTIESTLNNILNTVLSGYLELATKTLFNVRFHYISNDIVIFNMILRGVTEDATENNKKYSLSFYKPQERSIQDYGDDKSDDGNYTSPLPGVSGII